MSQTLLLPRWILTMKAGEDTLEHHGLLIDGERIADVGPRDEMIAKHPQATRVELPEQILIPGLINGHAHSAMTLLRGVA
ncbi:imidazolonepropionase-like domain-containing protein, partial [Streptococcus pyogenes]